MSGLPTKLDAVGSEQRWLVTSEVLGVEAEAAKVIGERRGTVGRVDASGLHLFDKMDEFGEVGVIAQWDCLVDADAKLRRPVESPAAQVERSSIAR